MYKSSHNQFGKVIHWEFCKKMKIDHNMKFYIYNPEYVMESEMQKNSLEFDD